MLRITRKQLQALKDIVTSAEGTTALDKAIRAGLITLKEIMESPGNPIKDHVIPAEFSDREASIAAEYFLKGLIARAMWEVTRLKDLVKEIEAN